MFNHFDPFRIVIDIDPKDVPAGAVLTTPPAEKGMDEVLTVQGVLWECLGVMAFQRLPNTPLGISQLYRST